MRVVPERNRLGAAMLSLGTLRKAAFKSRNSQGTMAARTVPSRRLTIF